MDRRDGHSAVNDWAAFFSAALSVIVPAWLALMVNRLLNEDE